jgi:hypothetical protein
LEVEILNKLSQSLHFSKDKEIFDSMVHKENISILGISLVIDPLTEYLGNPEFCGLHVIVCYPLFQINKVIDSFPSLKKFSMMITCYFYSQCAVPNVHPTT